MPLPGPVDTLNARPSKIHAFADGRAMLTIGGIEAGVYVSEQAAKDGVEMFKRLGVVSV